MGDLTKDFSVREFACKCGCGFTKIDPRIVDIVQKIRNKIKEPITINSACRCVAHNEKVEGVVNSHHTKGLALDIICATGVNYLYTAIYNLYKAGEIDNLDYCKKYFKKRFIHIDCGGKRKNRFVES